MALAYADAYPAEINGCLELHAHRDFAGMKKILPGLKLFPCQTPRARDWVAKRLRIGSASDIAN